MKPVFKQNILPTNLYPFSSLHEITDLRIGILTIKEKWVQALTRFPFLKIDIEIPNNLLPDFELFNKLLREPLSSILINGGLRFIEHPWNLFQYNSAAIKSDFQLLRGDKISMNIPGEGSCINKEAIFIEDGAEVRALFLDASEGPIYIDKNASIMAGSILKGPVYIGENTIIKYGTYIYSGSTIGANCTVGGEIKNSVIMDYSNKSHHGYVGDSVIGTWCNLGAGTSVSNIKNNASPIIVKDPISGLIHDVGQKCGLLMGDFSKSAINSSFNSGSIVGICSNVFHAGVLLPKYIPDFSWGDSNIIKYELEKLINDISKWMALKNIEPTKQLIEDIKKEYNK